MATTTIIWPLTLSNGVKLVAILTVQEHSRRSRIYLLALPLIRLEHLLVLLDLSALKEHSLRHPFHVPWEHISLALERKAKIHAPTVQQETFAINSPFLQQQRVVLLDTIVQLEPSFKKIILVQQGLHQLLEDLHPQVALMA